MKRQLINFAVFDAVIENNEEITKCIEQYKAHKNEIKYCEKQIRLRIERMFFETNDLLSWFEHEMEVSSNEGKTDRERIKDYEELIELHKSCKYKELMLLLDECEEEFNNWASIVDFLEYVGINL